MNININTKNLQSKIVNHYSLIANLQSKIVNQQSLIL